MRASCEGDARQEERWATAHDSVRHVLGHEAAMGGLEVFHRVEPFVASLAPRELVVSLRELQARVSSLKSGRA